MKNISAVYVLVICAAGATGATAKECVGLAALQEAKAASLKQGAARLMRDKPASATPDCTSVVSVLSKVERRTVPGGKRLETDRPLDPAEAQANLDEARRDPGIGKRLADVDQQTTDENLRLLLKAAVLDEEGYYAGRELLIQQLQQRLH
jgi:hypothetical protein